MKKKMLYTNVSTMGNTTQVSGQVQADKENRICNKRDFAGLPYEKGGVL